MGVSIERLRLWLLVGAGLLVVVIAAFLGYAHMRAHQFLKDLPGRLGVNISRESNGFTYSQSGKGGRTIYTIHAAKLVQYKDGKTTLHDVGIVLYGQKQDRADRIYGSEFEFDQQAGVVRAVGEVHLDLQAPAPTDARGRASYAAGHDGDGFASEHGDLHTDADERMVHVKTSGLVFLQKLGVASTDQEIEFQYHGMNGTARGADYNSDTGLTVLHSDVRVSGLRDGQPMILTASHAEMDRSKDQLLLAHARYVAVGESASAKPRDGGRTMTAERAVVQLRGDGSVQRLLASEGVSLAEGSGLLRGQNADVTVSAASRPETVHMSGGLTYADDTELRQIQGRAGEGTARFNGAGRVESALMTGAAEMHMREHSSAKTPWNERTVSGERIELRFSESGRGRRWLREGSATGDARMLLVERSAKDTGVETTSDLRGDTLTAQMAQDETTQRLSHITGAGHTAFRRHDSTGGEDTSQGDTLDVSFGEAAPKGRPGGVATRPESKTSITRAVQRGGVTLTHLRGRRPGDASASSLIRGSASQAVFEADGEALILTGHAQVTEGDNLVRAESFAMHRDSGDATADGGVSVSYRQTGSAEPLHVLAARADFQRVSGLATFFGGAGAPARLWQGASQVEAPLIEFSQAQKTLVARTNDPVRQAVRTVLVNGKENHGDRGSSRDQPQLIRVSSSSLRYSDADRRAQFGGGVVVQGVDGTVRGSEVTALLRPAAVATGAPGSSTAQKSAGFMGGSLDRVNADGGVEVSEQGRRATGERLVYTAADGRFVMTGTPTAPPKVVDDVQGTITGAALEFHAGDNSVMVLGNAKGGDGGRVHTETQVRQH